MSGRHTGSCGNASGHTCNCGGCAGARHGWPGCLDMARGRSEISLTEYRNRADKRWNRASKPPPKKPRRKPTKPQREAATDSAVGDIVDWLASHPTTAQQIEAIAEKLSTEVVAELDRAIGPARRQEQRKTFAAAHFWCDMLAALAKTLNEVQEEIDKLVGQVPKLVVSALEPQTAIGQATVKLAVNEAWNQIKEVDFVASSLRAYDLTEPLRATRMLAIMICPAPENHTAVRKHCLNPLAGECVNNVTKQRLKEALPGDWLD